MCLVHIWRVLFWRAFADVHADRGVSRTLLSLSRNLSRSTSFSIATREARLVLTAEVYNGSFAFVFRMQFDGESLMENSRSIKMQGEIR
jgi:hypothetical protein